MLAICDGLKFSLVNGFYSVLMESDACKVVNSIKNKCLSSSVGSIVMEILDLLNSVGGGSCQFVPHLGNELAYTLAKSFTRFRSDMEGVNSIPRFLASVVLKDSIN